MPKQQPPITTLEITRQELCDKICHPTKADLPRALFNHHQPIMHETERIVLDQAHDLDVKCEYEPFLFQMWDESSHRRLATAPDLWFEELGLIVEVGTPSSKKRKIRLLREFFGHIRFGIITNNDVYRMPNSARETRVGYLDWIRTTVERNDRELERLDKGHICHRAFLRARRAGASIEGAQKAAHKAALKF